MLYALSTSEKVPSPFFDINRYSKRKNVNNSELDHESEYIWETYCGLQ